MRNAHVRGQHLARAQSAAYAERMVLRRADARREADPAARRLGEAAGRRNRRAQVSAVADTVGSAATRAGARPRINARSTAGVEARTLPGASLRERGPSIARPVAPVFLLDIAATPLAAPFSLPTLRFCLPQLDLRCPKDVCILTVASPRCPKDVCILSTGHMTPLCGVIRQSSTFLPNLA